MPLVPVITKGLLIVARAVLMEVLQKVIEQSRIVERLRKVVPDMWFSTDIIVGFPGETEADFEQTRAVFRGPGL